MRFSIPNPIVWGLTTLFFGTAILPPAHAQQVVPDATVNTRVATPNGRDFTITDGGRSGPNLFHSFSEFSVPSGGSAVFNNAPDVQNIFSRVTGGSVSNIDGLIQANGAASLFLLNPSGVILGPGASLNIGGSFLSTTANSIKFADGGEFSAVTPTPLLTVSVPIGLQFGATPGSISVLRDDANTGSFLTLAPQQGFLLAGNNIQVNNTQLGIEGGRVDLASIAGAGTVDLIPIGNTYRFRVPANVVRGDVTLRATEEADTDIVLSGAPAGSFSVTAQNFYNTRSWIEGRVIGAGSVDVPSGDFIFDVLDTMQLDSGFFSTRINAGGIGKAGNIAINTGSFLTQNGAQITASLAGTGQAGNITLNARDRVVLEGFDGDDFNTILSSSLRRTGKGTAGTITINAPQITIGQGGAIIGPSQGNGDGASIILNAQTLQILDGGQIYTTTERAGRAGSIKLNAQDAIVIAGADLNWPNRDRANSVNVNSASGVYVTATTGSTGSGGDIEITTRDLKLQSGGRIDAGTFGSGAAGTIAIRAGNRVEVLGVSPFDGFNSIISAAVGPGAAGMGGNLSIAANDLWVADRGLITTATSGSGNAGEIRINAPTTALVTGYITSQSFGVGNAGTLSLLAENLSLDQAASISTESTNQGQAGNIFLRSPQIALTNGSQITSRSSGTGDGGLIDITAQTASLQRSTINAQTASGNGGNINLNIDTFLKLRDRSLLSAAAGGVGNGGNLAINAPLIIGLEDSDVVANAVNGNGGQIAITAQGIFGLKYRDRLTPENDITASSEFGVNGTVDVNTIGVDPNSGLMALPVDIVDPSQQIATGCANQTNGSFVITGRGGVPDNPIRYVGADRLWTDVRSIAAPTPIVVQSHRPMPAFVEATTWERNAQGQPELIAGRSPTDFARVTCAK